MVPNYCIPDAQQDLELARRTTQTMIYSGIWNPSVDSTYAFAGTVFIGIGDDPTVKGKMWQKQDDGCTTNWTPIGKGGVNTEPTTLYVDQRRTDSYTADGSSEYPFKTIMGAVNEVAARGDNSYTKPYEIVVRGGGLTYLETIDLNNTNLKVLYFRTEGDAYVVVQTPTPGGDSINATTNPNLNVLIMHGFWFEGGAQIINPVNGSNFCDEASFLSCLFNGGATVKGVLVFGVYGATGKINGNVVLENVFAAVLEPHDAHAGDMSLTHNGAAPAHVWYAGYSYAIYAQCVMQGSITTSADTILQFRHGMRIGSPGQTLTIGGSCEAFSSYIRSNISILAGAELRLSGTQVLPSATVTNLGTLTLNNDPRYIAFTPAIGKFNNPQPVNVNEALTRLIADFVTLKGGPIT